MRGAGAILAADVEVGHHHTAQIGGLTFNVDTIYSSIVAGLIVLVAGVYMARRATSGRADQAPAALGDHRRPGEQAGRGQSARSHPFVVPLAVALFFFILIANWLEMIPTARELTSCSPTADTNLTYAMALLVIGLGARCARRQKGLKGLLQALPAALPGPAAAEHPRGDRQADHAGPPTLRQHLRRRHHARPDRVCA